MESKKLAQKLKTLQERLVSEKNDAQSKYISSQASKREAINNNENKRKDLLDR